MERIKVEIKNKKIIVLENETTLLVNNELPTIFKKYLEIIVGLDCESLAFKYSNTDNLYSVILEKRYNEYIFKCHLLDSESIGKDTDQILKAISSEYCNLDDLEGIESHISSDKRMMLSIFLELKSIRKDLTSADKWRDKMEARMEAWQDSLEKKLSSGYLEKEDISLLNLLMKMPRLEMLLFLAILLGFVVVVDLADLKSYFNEIQTNPTQLTN